MKNWCEARLGDFDESSELRRQSVFDVDGIGVRCVGTSTRSIGE